MKAFGFAAHQPITGLECLTERSLDVPTVPGVDLLIEVRAVSINPLDLRVTRGLTGQTLTEPRILGWDGSGVVVAVGDQVTGFQVGDEVYWAGEFDRPGSYSQFQRVDHRLVALKPRSFCGWKRQPCRWWPSRRGRGSLNAWKFRSRTGARPSW
ncbi:alcohol dehydrogenase catalytic domain-containing protein [Deinococcus cellulosilyticus]|uniref:Alcohol dehydrogenase-like N-terminal domain-containing protein n=1 Tax=Deinococcus cellulosilyticus (strain DSM 18568 / NBRC 106333 / KACC 11606 / 5516J-15) TaxID=1223518 RepID=A0A511N1B1_DEIC1|nr:alcohol dehydrogenase catalytic domain-containing protein [Deinococcus cellulosilyticus]GEM46665.1 hypothetical protein DC3_23000 [Deinococcus cellulosilyticus NBRC 106333 = KACC 11606]